MIKVTIYANYGCLAAEKRTIYTIAPGATAALSEPLDVIIPDEFYVGKNDVGEILVTLPDSPYTYGLSQVLGGDTTPCLVWVDQYLTRRHKILKVVPAEEA